MIVKLTELPSFTDAALGVIVYDGKPRFVILTRVDIPTWGPSVDQVDTITLNYSVISFTNVSLAAVFVIVPTPVVDPVLTILK